jgi:hypothetical protein
MDNPVFGWFRDQILCSGHDDMQLVKLVRIASALNAHVAKVTLIGSIPEMVVTASAAGLTRLPI